MAVLFYFQFRSLNDLGRSSAVVLRQLSQETADGVERNIEDALKSPYINVLLGIAQRQLEAAQLVFVRADAFGQKDSRRNKMHFKNPPWARRS